MNVLNDFFQYGIRAPVGFDYAEKFPGFGDFPLPPVATGNWADSLNTGAHVSLE